MKKTIPGTFGDKNIYLEIFPNKTKNILINIHGTYGNKYGSEERYKKFATKISKNEIANTVIYSSSRIEKEFGEITDIYLRKQEKFKGKNFEDEVNDLKNVYRYLKENSKTIFGESIENFNILLNGNSLGGILAFYLAIEYPEIQAISSIGTGLRIDPLDIPILSTFPEVKELAQYLHTYNRNYLMHYGDMDEIFSLESFSDLFSNVGGNKKYIFFGKGFNHQFKKINKIPSEIPYNKVYENIVFYFKNGFFETTNY